MDDVFKLYAMSNGDPLGEEDEVAPGPANDYGDEDDEDSEGEGEAGDEAVGATDERHPGRREVEDDADLAAGSELEATAFGALFATEDAREGLTAFLAKRPAAYQAR